MDEIKALSSVVLRSTDTSGKPLANFLFTQGDNFCDFFVCFSLHQALLNIGSKIKGSGVTLDPFL